MNFGNPVSAVMHGIQEALTGLDAVPRIAFAPPNGGAPVDIASFFDDVPRQIDPPYIAVGPVGFQPAAYAGCAAPVPARLRLRIYAYDTSAGRERAWTMVWTAMCALDSSARRASDLAPIDLPAPWDFVELPAVVQGGDVINPIDPKSVYFDLDMVVAIARA